MPMNNMGLGLTFTARDLASGTIRRLQTTLKGAKDSTEALGLAYERSMKQVKKGAVSVGIGVVGLLGINKASKAYGQFEYQLAAAGAVMRATGSDMRMLEKAAIRAGIETQFSPTEATQGLQALGAAGMDAKTSMDVLNPTLSLAAASLGQLGVGEAAQNVVGVLNAFGFAAEDASRRVDQLVRVTQLSNFQARDFSVGISQAAAQAKTANQSFESMLAVLGQLRNANMDVSVAATSYREAVRRLSGDKRAQKELSKLGVEALDKETNTIRDIGDIISEVIPKVKDMNAKERNLMLTRIFGVRGMKVYGGFMAAYDKALKEGKVALGDYAGTHRMMVDEISAASGTAKDNADALLQTSHGQRILLQGSIQTFQVLLGKLATPVLIPALKSLISVFNAFIKVLDMIPGPLRSMLSHFAGVALAMKVVTGSIRMMQGAWGLLAVGRMAAQAGEFGDKADKAAKGTGRWGKAMGGIKGAMRGLGSAIGGALPFIGMGVAAASALFSYFRAKEEEEKKRQIEIRQQTLAAQKGYEAAWAMARKLRAESARMYAQELKAAAKTREGAERMVEKMHKRFSVLSKQSNKLYQDYLLLQSTHGKTSKEAVAAYTKWEKAQARLEAANKATIAAEAILAEKRFRGAKTEEERQVVGQKVVAGRVMKERVMWQKYHEWKRIQEERIGKLSGSAHRVESKRFKEEQDRRKLQIRYYRQGTAAWAVRAKLSDRGILGMKGKAQQEALRKIAAPIEGRKAGVTAEAMEKYQGVLASYARGDQIFLPAFRDMNQLNEFAAVAKAYLGVVNPAVLEEVHMMLGKVRKSLIQGKVPSPGELSGSAPWKPPEAPSPGPPSGIGGWGGAGVENLSSVIMSGLTEGFRNQPRDIVQVFFDGKKLVEMVSSREGRKGRRTDGTGAVTGNRGVKGQG